MTEIRQYDGTEVEQVESQSTAQTEKDLQVSDVRKTVMQHFPRLWPAVEVGLATCATLLLSDNSNPVAVIYVGEPSTGKTTAAFMFETAKVGKESLCYRSDKFTVKAFVSHSANVKKEELEDIHLLKRIKHRVLLTPELAPIFTGKPDDLVERFSIITRVLDGQGLSTDSGAHGQINLSGDYLFAWLGCTTPFSTTVWKVMGQLGSRLFFLVMEAAAESSVPELAQSLKGPLTYKERLLECRSTVGIFLEALFSDFNGVRAVAWKIEDTARTLTDLSKPERSRNMCTETLRGHPLC